MQKNTITSRKVYRPVLFVLMILLIAGAGAYAWNRLSAQRADNAGYDSTIDYSPATEEEKQDSNQHKEDIVKQDETPPPAGGNTVATPVIVDASQYGNIVEVRAYVQGVYEDGGVCTITFTKQSTSFSKQVKAAKDARTTTCANLEVAASEFAQKGTWSATVTYSSAAAKGVSQSSTFEVK